MTTASLRPSPRVVGKEMNALRESLRMRADPYAGMSAVELLRRTPLERLEETVKALKADRPIAEVRAALVECIARRPAADFDTIKHIYLRHCGDPAK